MTVGDKTFKGLGVPLSGEFELTQLTAATDFMTMTGATSMSGDFLVLRDVDKTELLYIKSDGTFRSDTATDDGVRGMDVRHTGSRLTSGFNAAGNFVETIGEVSISAAQCYGLRVQLDASSATTIGGGREACLHLYMLANTSAAGASHSIIHVDTGGTNPHNFITFGQGNTTGAFMVAGATDSTGTHAIRCMNGSTTFYILCSTCDPR